MNIMNMPSEESMVRMAEAIETIGDRMGVSGDVNSWKDVQRMVRTGRHVDYFAVGDQFIEEYNGEPVVWDIIGLNHDKVTDPKMNNSMTIQAHNCLFNAQFSAPQAIASVSEELPAGRHYMTTNDEQIGFTTTKVIPAGGVIYIATRDGYTPLTLTTYAANRTTEIETGISAEVVEGEVDTVTNINDRMRARYGSNNYEESAIRQFLNSDSEQFKWTPQTDFDMPSTSTPYTGGGFLNLLSPDLVDVIGRVDKQVANNTVTDGGGQTVFSDRAFLLSRVEVYGGTEGTTTGEEAYPYYSLNATEPVSEAAEWRIKYLSGSPRYWWLRSLNVGNSHSVRNVNPNGYVKSSYAIGSYGFAPACTII